MTIQNQTFTHIVVGAGTAGCLLANRLSSKSRNRVLLVEAGGWDRNFWLKLPVGYYRSINNPSVSRHFATEPGEGTANRSINWPRGRVVGGSSSINGLIFIRGQREDFDRWEGLGNVGWSFKDVLPYFRRLENYSGSPSQFRGSHGDVQVSDLRNSHIHCEAWVEAGVQFGLPLNPDFNGESTYGVGTYQLSIGKRWRSSSANAFLRPALRRSNLTVSPNSMVERVLIREGVARGVAISREGESFNVYCEAEVVLCAGAIQSPQILQLSGIGPGELLSEYGVGVVVDRPEVGGNLQDHFQMRTIVEMKNPVSLNNQIRNPAFLLKTGFEWLFGGRGALTVGAGQVGGAARTPHASTSSPDVQFIVMPLSVDKPGEPLHEFAGFTASVWQCHPESRGRVDIQSPDYRADPRIDPNYLSEGIDRRTMVAGVKMLREIYRQPAFKPLWANEVVPGKHVRTDAEILASIRSGGGTVFHCVGTCRMGADRQAVVTPQLKVRGVVGLRVADASIMPTITSANTNAATYMIAEKASDMILRDS